MGAIAGEMEACVVVAEGVIAVVGVNAVTSASYSAWYMKSEKSTKDADFKFRGAVFSSLI